MGGFFYNLGQRVGTNLRKANWVLRSLTGTEAEAVQEKRAITPHGNLVSVADLGWRVHISKLRSALRHPQ